MKKNQERSDVTEVDGSGEDAITQDEAWVWLGASTAGVDFDTYVSVDKELTTCGVLCMEEMCGVVGSGSCMEEGQGDGGGDDDEAEFHGSTSCVSVNAFMYAHVTKIDQVNIVNTERLLFSLKWKGATKQMRINVFFLKRSDANSTKPWK
jgi:hypothetical protein